VDLPDPAAPDDLVKHLDTSASGAEDWHSISAALLERERSTGDVQAGWLMTAFDYELSRRVGENRKQKEAFGEKFSMGGSTYPIALEDVPVEVVSLWSSAAEQVTAPAARARLHHLLFERGEGNRGLHGRHAASAYLTLGTGTWSRLDRANCLHWAVDFSKRVGDQATAASVLPALVALANESLVQQKAEPGVALHALEVLAYEEPTHPDLPVLLERARASYREPFLTGHTIRIQEQVFRADPGKREQLRRETVLAYYQHGMNHPPGLLRMSFLEDAAKIATQCGLTDLAYQAVEAMQQMTIDDLDLKTFSATAAIAAEIVDAHVATLVNQPSLGDVFNILVNSEAPTGNVARNRAETDEIAKQTPFASLMPTKHLGDDGLARYTSTSDDDRIDEQLARAEGISLGIAGPVTARIIDQALTRFPSDLDDLVQLIQVLPHMTDSAARSIARALLAFQEGEYEAAATMAMPKIETLVRALCHKKHVLRFRPQRDQRQGPSTRGQYPQLGALLGQLRPWLDASWYRFFWTFLVSPFGPNLRNELLHGLTYEVTPGHAALTILATLRLALVPLPDAPGVEA
jgi:hypothetical protein